jgi:probable rRNA maturation factor
LSADAFRLIVQTVARRPGTPNRAFFARCARRAFGDAGGELVLRIVPSDESAELNRRSRGEGGATNVLAFSAAEPTPPDPDSDEPPPLGDLVICADLVAREAEAQGKTLQAHWAHLIVHGCLHLQFYDHMTDTEAEAMETRERELLAGLGIADPYAAGP